MPSPPAPKISVVIPTYNRADILPAVIEALLGQDFPREDFEILVIDDGSSDGTRAYLASVGNPVRFFSQTHGGAARARNLGAREARGRIVAFTDDDCRPEKEWLRVIENALRERGDRVALLGRTYSPFPANTFVHSVFKDSEPVVTCNFAVSHEAFWRVGGFDPHFIIYFEDEDLGLRLKKAGYPIVFENTMRVEHPSRYMGFRGFLRQRSYLQYFCYMSSKHPDCDHWRRHRGVVIQIYKRFLWFGIPLLCGFYEPRLFGLMALVLLLHFLVDGKRAWRCRDELQRMGFALRPSDFWSMTLLNWAVPFVDAWRIVKGYMKDFGKTKPWSPSSDVRGS